LKQETQIYPFSLLSKETQEELATAFSYEKVKKETILLEQEITSVEKVYLLSKGRARYYYELNNTKILTGELEPGDNFGGLSILLNDAVCIRSLKILEDSVFITLKAELFLVVCKANPEFQDYFTNEFGKCMLNKSFAGIISRRMKDKEFNLPFFNRPIRTIFQPNIITCLMETSIEDAAIKMSRNNGSAILIKKDKRTIKGIVTDADLRKKVIAKHMDMSQPISTIMSSPLISISAVWADIRSFSLTIPVISPDWP